MISVTLLGPLVRRELGLTWARREDGLYEATDLTDALVDRLVDVDEPVPTVLIDSAVFVAGSAVLSVLLDEDSDSDIDVFFAADLHEHLAARLRAFGWSLDRDIDSSRGECSDPDEAGHWVRGFARHVDLIPGAMPLAERLAGFDLTVCQVAWCGDRIVATAAALDDIPCRRLRVTRVTRPGRVTKYLDRGFSTGDPIQDARLRTHDVVGWTDSTLTREQALGRA